MYDLRITGGTVFDASQDLAAPADVLVQDGQVAAVGPDLPGKARQTLDATGRYVTPGLVDLHTHVYWGCFPLRYCRRRNLPAARCHDGR